MVISDEHRYVFVELPRTGSTAVSRELCEFYDGRRILHKHATYQEFLSHASAEQREYFAFGGIRNPLDGAVSLYFKLLSDHKGSYSMIRNAGWFVRQVYGFRARQFRFAQEGQADFSRFFLRFYRWPYDNWSAISHAQLDCTLRFERLADDFAGAVAGFGAELVRPLPVTNKTADRDRHFSDYYDSRAIRRAKWVFGVYMDKWGYDFPDEWGDVQPAPGRGNRFVHAFLNVFRKFYWRYMRPAVYARKTRDLRAQRRKRSATV